MKEYEGMKLWILVPLRSMKLIRSLIRILPAEVKIQLLLWTSLRHEGEGGIAPSILNLSTRRRWVVVFTPRHFISTPRKAVARTQRKGGWVDPGAYWATVETKDLVTTLGINPHFLGRPVSNMSLPITESLLPVLIHMLFKISAWAGQGMWHVWARTRRRCQKNVKL